MKPGLTRQARAAVAQAGEKKRQATIRKLIATQLARTGREPTVDEIAGLLASTPARIRFHLSNMRGLGP